MDVTDQLPCTDVNVLADSNDCCQYLHQHINEEETENKVNWSSYWANRTPGSTNQTIFTMLPLLQDEIATHAMDIIKEVQRNLNLDQPLVVTADQPVYALGKKVQWLYPYQVPFVSKVIHFLQYIFGFRIIKNRIFRMIEVFFFV